MIPVNMYIVMVTNSYDGTVVHICLLDILNKKMENKNFWITMSVCKVTRYTLHISCTKQLKKTRDILDLTLKFLFKRQSSFYLATKHEFIEVTFDSCRVKSSTDSLAQSKHRKLIVKFLIWFISVLSSDIEFRQRPVPKNTLLLS